MAGKSSVSVPHSKFKLAVAKVLEAQKFVSNVQKEKNAININLLYEDGKPKIADIKKVSKLGLRVYAKAKSIKTIKGGRGITVISTPRGVMTGKEAKAKKLGGEVICQIW